MKIDWKEAHRRLEAENFEIIERRRKKADERTEELKELGHERTMPGRAVRRMGVSGQPRSRIFAEKMAIPKGKR
jgi:hypothetical protein